MGQDPVTQMTDTIVQQVNTSTTTSGTDPHKNSDLLDTNHNMHCNI